ncbi:protein red1 [Podospora aff. communis PSN243]|uniref:Protein red1 n=1 Tax=Podospora aff. communis PSN243 TaxID=3040156 RepID=A0AAV9GH19_9PEZI|nr:protein red1 [Podospora aff. communis PSN243]
MSQYNYPYSNGSYSGPPPPPSQQPQQPYGYQQAPQYPPPAYNQPYDPVAAGINVAASHNSYNYNANQIPGLGIGPPPVPPPFRAVLDPNAWTQPPVYPTPVPGLAPNSQPPPAPFNGPPQQSASWASSMTPNASRVTQPPPAPLGHQTKSQPAPNDESEEGELSEGQFEDLYEPREGVQTNNPTHRHSKHLPTADPSQPTSAVATPEAGFYGNDDDEGPTSAVKDGVATVDGRERSGSYSPFLSPREIRTENTTPQGAAGNGDGPSSPFVAPNQSAMLKAATHSQPAGQRKNSDERGQTLPGLYFTSQQHSTPAAERQQPKEGAPKSQASAPKPATLTSLQEMKKEAQKAILRLWPLGVKFQHYIDEGFDEKVIKGLFGDLHLDLPKPVAEAPKFTAQESGQVTVPSSRSSQFTDTQPPTTTVKESLSKPDQKSQGEERKDRIARLLAAKTAKGPVATTKPASPQAASVSLNQAERHEQAPGTSTPPKPKPWGEKERLLQQKIADLQKLREARTQKLATGEPGQAVMESQTVGAATENNQSRQTPPFNANNKKEGAGQPNTLHGFLPPSATQPNQLAAHRRRPVAADFVDYSSTVGPSKRPFGQDPTQSSLIIDISDGSDDEEMDMDVDSPTDELLDSKPGSIGQRGPSIRDFPPLTDTRPTRQFSSPTPMSQTPPNGSMNGRRRETELDLKERAIQEMRRKIAEAEAKRKAKKSPGSQTPQASHTPELKENETLRLPSAPQSSTDGPSAQLMSEIMSARLPKVSDRLRSGQQGKAERRGRIVSFELPRIDDSLEDKIRRLNQLRDEEQRLKAEIDNELARKRLLTEELEQINIEPSDSTPQLSRLSSASSSAPHSQTENVPVEQTSSSSGSPSGTSDQGPAEQSDGDNDISMDEDQSSRESSQSPAAFENTTQLRPNAMETESIGAVRETTAKFVESQGSNASKADHVQRIPSSNLEKDDRDASALSVIAEQLSTTGAAEVTELDDTQAELGNASHDNSSESEADSLSPSRLTPATGHGSADEDMEVDSKAEGLDQISMVGQPREDLQEIEDAQTIDGVVAEAAPKPPSKSEHVFRSYCSPLRYFRAYRYHSEYPSRVAGGLKSLTYSNRIDPTKALCPYELSGQQCPVGCDFQHFGSIQIPDDQILVELGRADDYIDDQKNRFISGLRALLQELRANKVKDFDAIARGIIDYRATFLGDKSKILPLEGVTL